MTDEAELAHLSGWPALARVLGERRYVLFMSGSSISMAGQWMQRIALGWLMWEQTRSGVWLGALAIAELAPGLLLGPLGGVLTDRMDRRKLVIMSQAVLAAQSIVVGLCVIAGFAQPAILVALVVIAGAFAAVQETGRSLLVRDVTPKEALATGMALNAIAINVTRFLGPAIAGPILAVWGPAAVCIINAATSLVFLWTTLSSASLAASERHASHGSFLGDMWRGIVAASTHATIAPVLLLFGVLCLLLRPLYELMPAFAERLFQGGVAEYSHLVMSVGVGATIGAGILAFTAPKEPRVAFMWSSVGVCVCVATFAVAPSIDTALAIAAALGFCMCINATSSQLVMVMDAPAAVSGRVLSLWGSIIRAMPAVGAIIVGASLDFIGYRWPLWIGAFVCAVILVAILIATRRSKANERGADIEQREDFGAMPGAIVQQRADL